eukprot:8799217-Ditylum_brightwellii.AAC.1
MQGCALPFVWTSERGNSPQPRKAKACADTSFEEKQCYTNTGSGSFSASGTSTNNYAGSSS